MLLDDVLVSNSTLDLRFLLDMLRHNDRRLGEVIRVGHPLDGDNVQEHNAHEVAHELEDQLTNVGTAVAIDNEAEHHAECSHAAEDAGHARETLWVVRERSDNVLGRDLIDATILLVWQPMRKQRHCEDNKYLYTDP